MAKFIAYYNICPIQDCKDLLGLSPDRDNGNIIATLGKNITIVIKINTQKQIRSWSVLEKFSCKVVFDHRSQQYVGVFASRYLRKWDETTTNVNKCKKLKFHKTISDLIYDPIETLVLYSDGTCESLSSAIESRKEHPKDDLQFNLNNAVNYINPKIITLENGRKYLTYFQKNKLETPITELVKIELDENTLKPVGEKKRFALRRSGQGVNVAGYSVIEVENAYALLTIWDDGRVFLLNLTDSVDTRNSHEQFVSMFTDLRVDTPLIIRSLSKHCVAIYGANNTQEGGSLILYNTQFKVVKAKQFFKVYFNNTQLWAVGATILLAMGQNLSVVTYQMSKELLSDLVGSKISNDLSHVVESEFANEEEELEEQLTLAETNNLSPPNYQTKERKKDTKIQTRFADGKETPFKGDIEFNSSLNTLMNRKLSVELVQDNCVSDGIEVTLMSNFYDNGFVTKEVEVIAKEFEQCGASEHEISEKLLWVLIKADLVEDIAICLRRYTTISEKILVTTLKYALQDFDAHRPANISKPVEQSANHCESMDVDMDLNNTISTEADYPCVNILAEKGYKKMSRIQSKQDLITTILSCTFDISTISFHISRELGYDEVFKMLEYLYILITSKEPCLEERPDCPDKIDDDLRILRWFGVFLNTHFQKMTLSKDVHLCELLLKWHDVLKDYKQQLFELEKIAALLYNIVDKKQISKERNYSKWYSIEEVRLY